MVRSGKRSALVLHSRPPLCGAAHLAGVTLFKIVLLLVVAVAAYTQGSASNMTPFTNTVWDADGVFMGASLIFFSFTGARMRRVLRSVHLSVTCG
jgi:amino acid transporter